MSLKGVNGTTLSDIAKDCNISRGTLYYYYRSKNDLILGINEWNMNKLTTPLLTLLDSSIAEGKDLSSIMLEVIKTISKAQTRGRMHLYLLNEAISNNPGLLDKLRESYSQWFCILESSFEKILPDPFDREAIARAIVASIDGLMIQNILSMEKIPLNRVVDSMVSGFGV